MSKIEKYLGIANYDIQVANNSDELKSYVASILCEIAELKQENKQLKMINKEYERLNKEKFRGFKIINVQEYNIDELLSYKKYKDNWNKLKEYIQKDYDFFGKLIDPKYGCAMGALSRVKNKIQELEQGSDSNVKD